MDGAREIRRAASVVACAWLALALALAAANGASAHGSARPPATAAGMQERVRATIVSLRARDAALARAAAGAAVQLRVARRSLAVAQRNLALRVRDLYVTGGPPPLEVLLGADSLGDALTQLDDLRRAADQDRAWIRQSRALRRTVMTLSETIADRRRALAILRASTGAAAAALVDRRATAGDVPTRRLAARIVAAPPVPTTMTVVASAYGLRGSTATGTAVGRGTVAVDPAVIPLGTRLSIPGYGEAVASDTGSAIRGARIDVWLPTVEDARAWGTRTVTVTIHRG